ncbi:MAG TPA: 4Fe-4S binding protein [Bryobacteraceae bacterium]|nr:4Fe-4S binding protein [Bryobacteraceae bacterium]
MTDAERPALDLDIVCVGFGPATAGFLATLSRRLMNPDGTPAIESMTNPGLPLQVACYERADDLGFGVSGVVTRARGIRATMPDLDPKQIPMAAPVTEERLVYLLDPIGASRRSRTLKLGDRLIRSLGLHRHLGVELPYVPPFLHKHGGLVMSLGQFLQFVGSEIGMTGTVQLWPGMPVQGALIDDSGEAVRGVRLCDQGVDAEGCPEANYMPGMDIRAALTVVGDGPVGAVGRQLDEEFGLPDGHHHREWAVGMKMVVDLPKGTPLEPGTVFHTFGYPEPEIFGFFYVHPDGVATAGIFVSSWFRSPMRTSYRYLQHFMLHPYLWRYLEGGRLRSWGAKSLQESGKRGEPILVGNGYARIGEGSGSTNVLTGSGVDEAWTTGAQLAEAVLELLGERKPLSKENLEATYVSRRRASWVEQEGRIAEKARDGFHRGLIPGLLGMALAGFTDGKRSIPGEPGLMPDLREYYRGKIPSGEVERIMEQCRAKGLSCHNALMERCGWPAIPYDGHLLVSHQDALLIGGKVQAPPGYADHVRFVYPDFCESCNSKLCIEMCSGQAITPGPAGVPLFDREKCVHCGACLWNCPTTLDDDPARGNIVFRAGAGGLHSGEN